VSRVELHERIPNNVSLSSDRRLLRALEQWQPKFLAWWSEMGPEGFQAREVYLRTAAGTDARGWAHFGFVRMPEYRWGIFLADPVADRRIGFGDDVGKPVWQEVPGEHRAALRRLIVTQADTEPASVEQQRRLGRTCPSRYDLRNLFQVNVEEGRHLWAMVYLLHTYFGRDGRDEADALLRRRSGDADHPRLLGAFNAPIDDWLSFFLFTYFTDRDGKYQLLALSESAFDPLARTTRFMLTEEAHHMFVGETGVLRVVQRTAEAMRERPGADLRSVGAVDLPLLQRYLNFWYSISLDLFGGEISSNAASYFAAGLKGRAREAQYADHRALDATLDVEVPRGDALAVEPVPLRNAMNEVLRREYRDDSQRGVDRFNRVLEAAGIEFRLALPSARFHRRQGVYAGRAFDPQGKPISAAEWEARRDEWLPSASDRAYLESLMARPVVEPGKVASWIAPPKTGIRGRPVDYEYVRLD
jgi:benzoyl-CoA 2,3-dioxygenase component B